MLEMYAACCARLCCSFRATIRAASCEPSTTNGNGGRRFVSSSLIEYSSEAERVVPAGPTRTEPLRANRHGAALADYLPLDQLCMFPKVTPPRSICLAVILQRVYHH